MTMTNHGIHCWQAFGQGYDNPTERNPYLWSSDTADAFELGRFMRVHNWTRPLSLRKSRGYYWRIAVIGEEIRVRVDGGEVTGIEYAPAEHRAHIAAAGYVATQLVDVTRVDGLTYTARLARPLADGVWLARVEMADNEQDGTELVAHVSQIAPATPPKRKPKPKPAPREEAAAHGAQLTIAGTWHQPTDTERQGRLF